MTFLQWVIGAGTGAVLLLTGINLGLGPKPTPGRLECEQRVNAAMFDTNVAVMAIPPGPERDSAERGSFRAFQLEVEKCMGGRT